MVFPSLNVIYCNISITVLKRIEVDRLIILYIQHNNQKRQLECREFHYSPEVTNNITINLIHNSIHNT